MAVAEDNEPVNWKETYRGLKKKLKILLHENECYQAELRRSQGQLLQATRDRTFLLERLMQYQNVDSSASDSEVTDESEPEIKPEAPKRKKNPEPTNGPSPTEPKKKRTSSSRSNSTNTRSVTPKSNPPDTNKPAGRTTSTSRGNRPSIEMSDSSSGFADSLMNAR